MNHGSKLWVWNKIQLRLPGIPKEGTGAMLVVFYEHLSTVHHNFTPPGHTINKNYYIKVLHKLRGTVKRNRCSHSNSWLATLKLGNTLLFLHVLHKILGENPDLAPWDLYVSPKLKFPLKWLTFQNVYENKENAISS